MSGAPPSVFHRASSSVVSPSHEFCHHRVSPSLASPPSSAQCRGRPAVLFSKLSGFAVVLSSPPLCGTAEQFLLWWKKVFHHSAEKKAQVVL
ncbi:hypothetical protein S83_054629 [Arachis hypogaea]